MDKKEIDHVWTSNIVCPHCGAEWEDDGHYFPGNSDRLEDECYVCGGRFQAERDFCVYYTTTPLEERT